MGFLSKKTIATRIILLFFLLHFSDGKESITTVKGTLIDTAKFLKKCDLIFNDNFEKFDENIWERQHNTNGHFTEFQYYTTSEENSFVKDGKLHIKPTLCAKDSDLELLDSDSLESTEVPKECIHFKDTFYPINSARLATQNSIAFKYGFLEIRAKIPSGDWLWPAIWLLPKDKKYQEWPRSGEIDLMESRGNKHLRRNQTSVGCDQIGSTLHFGPDNKHDAWRKTTASTFNDSFSSTFHKYQLLWTSEKILFLVDDKVFQSITPPSEGFWKMGDFDKDSDLDNPWINGTKMAPFDQEFFIIMNVAVGGTTFFSDQLINEGGKPWKNTSPQPSLDFWNGRKQWLPTWNLETEDSHMIVDHVRIWAA